jgi:hypothetical protein
MIVSKTAFVMAMLSVGAVSVHAAQKLRRRPDPCTPTSGSHAGTSAPTTHGDQHTT